MKKVLKDYFIPHEENNHTPHLFRQVSLVGILVIAVVMCVSSLGSSYLVKNSSSLLGNIYTAVLVDLTNDTRVSENKTPLIVNPQLEFAAQLKASDMVSKNYFAHTSPEGITPWYWFKKAGYSFSYAGENLAVGFVQSEDVNNGWLNSPTHKANIIDEHFTEIGIATMKGVRKGKDAVYVVQMFGKPKTTLPVAPKTILTEVAPATLVATNENTQSANVLSATAEDSSNSGTLFVKEVYNDDSLAIVVNDDISQVQAQNSTASDTITVPHYSTRFERFIANQSLLVSYVLLILMVVVLVGLLIFLVHEVRMRHYKHFLLGVLVFLVLLGLWIWNDSMILFPQFV
ncbi:MAG: hypothetical protein KBC42_01485 [Candidatus Pacebacteria bacterium]|nr:hypothetical protein [Candidatus Paceibacterota bacterium]MBP9780578.1 hypothetical protein [Candidatus Paceibacterota bacterium]